MATNKKTAINLSLTPATPPAGWIWFYSKDDGLYYKDEFGAEVGPINTSGSSSSSGSGIPGFAGPDGEPGEIGPPGIPGAAGSTGPAGIDGRPGIDGNDGDEGLRGVPGQDGIAGPAGIQGLIGPPGYQGEDGEIGQMGIPGPTGPQGPAGSGGSATTVEVNVSVTPVTRGKFTITDAAISGSSKVLVWQAPGPYTGKGTLADEAELQPIEIIATTPAAGSAICYWRAKGHVAVMPQSYYDRFHGGGRQVAVPAVQASMDNIDSRQLAIVIGRAQKNIKFSYMIL